MIGIIISFTIAIVCFFIFTSSKFTAAHHLVEATTPKAEIRNYVANIGIFAFSGALVLSILFDAAIYFSMKSIEMKQSVELVASQEIIALKDDSLLSGDFFLGSGSINENDYYVYYINTEHGYKKEKIDADDHRYPVYIKYISANETPHIDQYSVVTRKILLKDANIWFSILHYLVYKDFNLMDTVESHIETPAVFHSDANYFDNFRIEIFIPKGSILQDYKIDME